MFKYTESCTMSRLLILACNILVGYRLRKFNCKEFGALLAQKLPMSEVNYLVQQAGTSRLPSHSKLGGREVKTSAL